MIRSASLRGRADALARFKLAGPMGADIGVAPLGDEQSHGTQTNTYPPRGAATAPNGQDPDMSNWLWQLSTYDKLAPGRADGTFGQEVIG